MPTLGTGQSAEPKQCGSCQYFRHRQEKYDTFGDCSLKLPPWLARKFLDPLADKAGLFFEVSPRTVQDTETCDFYEPKNVAGEPVEFVQQRVWQAGNPSR